VILAYARILQREAIAGNSQPWLLGKHIGLFSVAGHGEESMLLRRAATELGAKLAQVRPFAAGMLEGIDVQNMARLIGRLRRSRGVRCAVRPASAAPLCRGRSHL